MLFARGTFAALGRESEMVIVRKPYPKHKAGLAAIPLYVAAFLPCAVLSTRWWLVLLLWIPCWFLIDIAVFRFLIWQVNSLRRPIWRPLLMIVGVGLLVDLGVVGLIYAVS
jgi:hypothetical protein